MNNYLMVLSMFVSFSFAIFIYEILDMLCHMSNITTNIMF